MTERIFVGGFGGSGTRVIQMVLEQAGYDVGPVNAFYDWHGLDFVPPFEKWYFRRSPALRLFMEEELRDKPSFSVKVGLLMYCVEELREWFPGCKFIYVHRNPWDQMSNEYQTHARYGNLAVDAPLFEKVRYWCDVSRPVMRQADLCVCLEELVDKPAATIWSILKLASVTDDPARYVGLVKRPDTIGRAREHYGEISSFDAETRAWLRTLYSIPGATQ